MRAVVRRAAVLSALLVALLGLMPAAASAHQPRPTLVTVSTGSDAAHPTLQLVAQLPLDKLRLAYGIRMTDDPAAAVTDQAGAIADLVAPRVQLTSEQGPWTVVVDQVLPARLEGRDTAEVRLTATPPTGAVPRRVELRWQVITDVVFTHKVYVAGTDAEGADELVGLVTTQQPTLALDVAAPQVAQESRSMLAVGFGHFREGIDHHLFLCLVALAAVRRRAGPRTTLRRLAALTVMFTVGHSLSLALASAGLVTLPSRWVETGIAVTILLAAAHAVRPSLRLRVELAVTGLFGLVHGFGFAGTLADLSLHGRALVVPVLTFNVGLEAAQLLALAAFLLPLWVVGRSRTATGVLAGAIGVVALSWVAQRTLDVTNPLDTAISALVSSPERLALLLVLLAALASAKGAPVVGERADLEPGGQPAGH